MALSLMDIYYFDLTNMDTFIKVTSSFSRTLTDYDMDLLRTGCCVHGEGVDTYYFSNWFPFCQEIKKEMQPVRKIIKKKNVPKKFFVCASDWEILDDLPIEERCITLIDAVSGSRRQRKLIMEEALERRWLYNWILAFPSVCYEYGLLPIDYDTTEVDTMRGILLREGIESNPGPLVDPTEVLIAQMKGLFLQQNFSCGLNEFVQLHKNASREIAVVREAFTPDHDPRFLTTINLKIDGITYVATARDRTKVSSREKAAKSVLELALAGEEHYLECLPSSHWLRDLLREGIEANPGPPSLEYLSYCSLIDQDPYCAYKLERFFPTEAGGLGLVFQGINGHFTFYFTPQDDKALSFMDLSDSFVYSSYTRNTNLICKKMCFLIETLLFSGACRQVICQMSKSDYFVFLESLFFKKLQLLMLKSVDFNHFRLLLSGDVELNPGPPIQVSFRPIDYVCVESVSHMGREIIIDRPREVGNIMKHEWNLIVRTLANFTAFHQLHVYLPEDFRHFHSIYYFYSLRESTQQELLKLCGDIESNPGPVLSKSRINDPRDFGEIVAQMRVFEQIDKAVGGVDDLNGNFKRLITVVEQFVPMLANNISQSTSVLHESAFSFGVTLETIKGDLFKFCMFFFLLQGLFLLGQKKIAVCSVLIVLAHSYGLDESIISYLKELYGSLNDTTVQGGFEEELLNNSTFCLVGKIIFSLMAFLFIKQIPGKKDWDTYLNRLARLPQAADGSKKIWNLCSDYFNIGLESCKHLLLGKENPDFQSTNDYIREIKDWMKEVERYSSLAERNKVDLNPDVAHKVSKLWAQGQKYAQDWTLPNDIKQSVSKMLFPAHQLFKYVEIAPTSGGGPKIRPVNLWLIGDSQIGKSCLVWALCADLLKKMGYTPEEADQLIYARQAETEFWDGFRDFIPIVLMDDAFALKDDKLKPNPEISEVIRTNNMFPCHVHMAALSDKNTFLKAKFMIYTSNEPNVECHSLTHPQAFYTRMNDNAFKVVVKDQYRKLISEPNKPPVYMLDKSKRISPHLETDYYEFQQQKYDFVTKKWQDHRKPITYEQLRTRLIQDWRAKQAEFTTFCADIKERMKTDWVEVQGGEEFQDAISYEMIDVVPIKIREMEERGMLPWAIAEWFAQDDDWWKVFRQYKLAEKKKGNLFSQAIATCQHYIDQYESALKNVLKKYRVFEALAVFGAVSGVIFGLYQFFKTDEDAEVELAHSGAQNSKKPKQIFVHGGTPIMGEVIEAQGTTDPNAWEIISHKIDRNTFLMKVDKFVGNVTFVRGKVFLMPFHYISLMQNYDLCVDEEINLFDSEGQLMFKFPLSRIFKYGSGKLSPYACRLSGAEG